MFEKLFKQTTAVYCHKIAPYSEERERFLTHCTKEGYRHDSLVMIARELLWAAFKLKIQPNVKITTEEVNSVANDWSEREHSSGHALNTRQIRIHFIRIAKQWLRFLGCLHEPVKDPDPFADLINDFLEWMHNERGLATSTIELQIRNCREFLCWYEKKKRPFAAVEVSDIDSFLKQGSKRWSRLTIYNYAASLRAFFRHAGMRGWCRSSIASAIQGPRIYSQENLPMGPSWQDVKRLLSSTETNKPRDIRDRAILMFFAIYGLRSSEVSKLKLKDINWEHDQILVLRSKRRQCQIYPLIPTVGNAILRYLQEVRPRCSHRELFLTLRAPLKSMSGMALGWVTRERMIKLRISTPHKGPHSLRHACATHLVSEKFTLKEIGDHLGHVSSASTRVYAKVDLPGLREVAAFDLGGVS